MCVRAADVQKGIRAFEQDIKSSGFYKNKTKNILAAAKMIQKDFYKNFNTFGLLRGWKMIKKLPWLKY